MGVSWLLKYVLVLVLVLIITSVESLTGNVCTRIVNYTETWRESYEVPVNVRTTSWCFSIPPRCSRYRTEYRTHYRIKGDDRQKNISECCTGYTKQNIWNEKTGSFIDSCVAHSICKPGYIGNNCTIECPTGTWGILCKNTCSCSPEQICNPTNGSCSCPPGWKGSGCDNKCEDGKWGIDCSTSCSCTNGSRCHHETGACLEPESTDELHENSNNNILELLSSVSFAINDDTGAITLYDSSYNDEINANFLKPTTTVELLLAVETTTKVYEETTITTLSTLEPIINEVINDEKKNTTTLNVTAGQLENVAENVRVPLPSKTVTAVVGGLIVFLVSAIIVVLAFRHVKLFDTIRLSIYDPEKPDNCPTTLPKEKGNEGKIHPTNRASEIHTPPLDYETPKYVLDRPPFLPRPNSTITNESTYYNQYPNIILFNSPQELLEAQYDKPPPSNTFSLKLEFLEGEHLYDEIPLQSTVLDKK